MQQSAIKPPSIRGARRMERLRALRLAQIHRLLAGRLAESAAAQSLGVDLQTLRARTRQKARIAMARQLGMYLTHRVFAFSFTTTGMLFRRDRTTVRHACLAVSAEEANVASLARLEPALRLWAERFAERALEGGMADEQVAQSTTAALPSDAERVT
jgi:Bacterial dnaA protein helix-turn-helix